MNCLITGATRGIGRAAAVALAQKGVDLILVARDPARADETLAAIRAARADAKAEVVLCDLSSQKDIRRLAGELKQQHPRIDVLINNAGGMFTKRETTIDGIEWTFAVNHLAYFLLTNLLRDVIQKRVVSVSSGAHMQAHMDFTDLQFERRAYRRVGLESYAQSKLANILFTRELSRRLQGTGVTANCMHPGFVDSGFGHQQGGLLDFGLKLLRPFMLTAEEGADTLVYLATSPEVATTSGEYFFKRKIKRGSRASQDLDSAKKLWDVSEKLTGLAG